MLDVVVLLYGTGVGAIAEFEREAIPMLREHGAELLSAFRPEPATGGGAAAPDEVHVLRFPSQAAFAAYRADRRLARLSGVRQRVIARSEVLVSRQRVDY